MELANFMKSLQKLLGIIVLIIFCSTNSYAGISLIRDSETEDFLKELSNPLIRAAGLKPEEMTIYIVNDSAVNAFAISGQNMFFNTGLIIKYENPPKMASR